MMACTPPGCTCTHFVTSYALPLMTTQTSLSVVCLPTSSMVRPPSAFAPPPATGAAAPPRGPFSTGPLPPSATRFFSTVPALWIMFHSSEASWPMYAMMACSPPGWMGIHLVTSMTCPLSTIQASSLVLCFFTSSIEMPLGPSSTGAGGPLACKSLTMATSSSFVMSSSFFSAFSAPFAPLASPIFGDDSFLTACSTILSGAVKLLRMSPRKSWGCFAAVTPAAAARPAMRPE
mmetsp:Transcript_89373/g.273694  ORF Transcript_89373/g.273694 Transcript_89373/m.273694 type:complete len:233 (+) Transcript_89373:1347-2045(+)